jgi:hypothetical protein
VRTLTSEGAETTPETSMPFSGRCLTKSANTRPDPPAPCVAHAIPICSDRTDGRARLRPPSSSRSNRLSIIVVNWSRSLRLWREAVRYASEYSCPRANIRGHPTRDTSLLEVGICLDSASSGLCNGNPIPSPLARCNIQLILSSVNSSRSQGPLSQFLEASGIRPGGS